MTHRPDPDIADADIGPSLKELIARISTPTDLSGEDSRAAFNHVMGGRASQIQVAGLLVGLRTKGEAASEVAGGVRALRDAMLPVEATDPDSLVDTCGTGGGALTTFNISTAAAILAAGMGVRIAKHGNRSFTSRCGSADILEALGVQIELEPEAMAAVLEEAGIVFMFAPLLHPAMRHVAPVRRGLGIPTIMNLLGPLTNPAGARRQVVGVTNPALLDLVAHGLRELGHHRALVVFGEPGLDELSPLGTTHVAELDAGTVRRYEVTPGDFGWDGLSADDLAGGEPGHNARVVMEVFEGERHDAARAAVVLNAGAAVYVSGTVASLEEGVQKADAALADGAALDGLERLRSATRRVLAEG
ncbi:MAG: anthranilate phosphoribosyltransferase [Longimicrobiales bacterium]